MKQVVVNDLRLNPELDAKAMVEIVGLPLMFVAISSE